MSTNIFVYFVNSLSRVPVGSKALDGVWGIVSGWGNLVASNYQLHTRTHILPSTHLHWHMDGGLGWIQVILLLLGWFDMTSGG